MKSNATFALLVLLFGGASPALVAAQPPAVEQVAGSYDQERGEGVRQVYVGARSVNVRPITGLPDAMPVEQLSPGKGETDSTQLTDERRQAKEAVQLYQGKPTAEASSLSKPSEGRTGYTAAVGGKDRCDVNRHYPPENICSRVIETRASEFRSPTPTPLSPEQRLLVEQRIREGHGSTESAVRRLGEKGDGDQSIEGQGIASIVLRPPPAPVPQKDPLETLSPENQALVNAFVAGIVHGPSPQ